MTLHILLSLLKSTELRSNEDLSSSMTRLGKILPTGQILAFFGRGKFPLGDERVGIIGGFCSSAQCVQDFLLHKVFKKSDKSENCGIDSIFPNANNSYLYQKLQKVFCRASVSIFYWC